MNRRGGEMREREVGEMKTKRMRVRMLAGYVREREREREGERERERGR